jgi:hypothetical protein
VGVDLPMAKGCAKTWFIDKIEHSKLANIKLILLMFG